MDMRTLGQRRAAQALAAVRKLEANETMGEGYGNFVSYVDRLPASIVMNGLGQAMATELAASEPPHRILFDFVEEWLKESGVYPRDMGLMDAIVHGSQEEYVRAQEEALAYLEWVKKFGHAYLKGGKDASTTL